MRARLEHAAYELWGSIDQPSLYDHLTARIIRRVVGPRAIAVDVGAHEGALLRHLLRRALDGKVYAFEPLAAQHARLQTRYGARRNLVLHHAALGSSAGTVPFYEVVSNPGYSGLSPRNLAATRGETIREISARIVRLDDIIPVAEHVDFIKIDVEGAELEVLRGASATLARARPTIVFEHGQGGAEYFNSSPALLYDFLHEHGLAISLMPEYLRDEACLSRADFIAHFDARWNSYFVAHAAR